MRQGSNLNRVSINLRNRRTEKLKGRIPFSQVMPVKNLIEDLLKNGIDLSNMNMSNKCIYTRKNHSFSIAVKSKKACQRPSNIEGLDVISEEESTPHAMTKESTPSSPSKKCDTKAIQQKGNQADPTVGFKLPSSLADFELKKDMRQASKCHSLIVKTNQAQHYKKQDNQAEPNQNNKKGSIIEDLISSKEEYQD